MRKTLEERFWEKVARVDDETRCWLWQASMRQGYGAFGQTKAHRVAYELTHGSLPVGLVIAHLCNQKACCRPDHLRAMTYGENTRDAFRDGLVPGAKRVPPLVTPELARAIRERVAAGEKQSAVAADTCVDRTLVSRIVSGKRHVDREPVYATKQKERAA